jgi:secreted Zn-dependent insulinase-like peptidase
MFTVCHEKLIRTLRSWNKDRPDSQADSLLSFLLQEGAWLPNDRLKAVEAADTDYLMQRLKTAFQYNKITAFAHGQIKDDDENNIANVLGEIKNHVDLVKEG